MFDDLVDEDATVKLAQSVFLKLDSKDFDIDENTPSLFALSVGSKQTIEEAVNDDVEVPEVRDFAIKILKERSVNHLKLWSINIDITNTVMDLKVIDG